MPLVTASHAVLALFFGYAVAVGLSMAATFGITAASRSFVSKDHRLRRGYKYTQEAMWLVCAIAGGYGAAMVKGDSYSWIVGPGLVVILISVLWINAWEMRQRGLGHQIAMSIASAAGVTVGFLIHLR